MYLIDHTDKIWLAKVRRVNGALTYSKDLVKYQVPHWEKFLSEDDILSTCPKFSDTDVQGQFKTAYQYLHSYPYHQAIERTAHIAKNLPFKANKIVFISAYKAFAGKLNTYGLKTLYRPMAIDAKDIQKHAAEHKDFTNRIIYFGNVIQNKVHLFNQLKVECDSLGLEFDYISNGSLNGQRELTREETLNLVSRYTYGIGVGRCAQEMMALGVKTLIAGHKFGGLITNEEEYQQQLATNMNGRIITYDQNIRKCLRHLDKSILRYNDITEINHAQAKYEI